MVKNSDLEDLPDEILIEICLYLSIFDILYSFGRLNKRLQCTINEFRSELDLSSFSLNEFQRFYSPCLLKFIFERINKLSLSNEYTPGQIELFDQLIDDQCFKTKLPFLKSLKLMEFTNDNRNILPKILYIKELDLQFNSNEKITKETENFFHFYLFGRSNHFEKLRLYINTGFKMKSQIEPHKNLNDLSIEVDTMEDLLILFTVVPNLIRLEVDIVRNGPLISISEDKMPKYLKELYFHTIDKEIIPFKRILKPLICNIPSIEYLSFGLRSNDPDYADAFHWIDLIDSMPHLNTFILGLEIDITLDLIFSFNINTIDELKQAVFNSFMINLRSFPVNIYTNTQTLFIDSIPYRFNRDQSYNTSPEAVRALNTDSVASQQSSYHIIGLSMNGEHIPIRKNDYLSVIQRFPCIKWLYLDWINVIDENEDEEIKCSVSIKLKSLKSLIYMRSTSCKVNRSLFDQLFNGHKRLDTLKMMYGDLIYLLRSSSSSINGIHIKNLFLSSCGADGIIHLKDLNYFISTFPLLKHFSLEVTSNNLIKKNQIEIINQLITSFKQLRSFRIVSHRGEIKFVCSLIENEQIKFKWLSHINALGSHLILKPKSLHLWKSDCQTTYL